MLQKSGFAFLLIAACLSFMVARAEHAPDFTLPTTDGNVSLSALRGNIIYVDFWATWCPPCRKSFPWMNEMQARYGKDGLKIVAISVDKEREPVDRFLKEMGTQFIIAFDPQGAIAEQYHLKGMPGSYLIDREGNLYLSHLGFRDKDKAVLEDEMKKLLGK